MTILWSLNTIRLSQNTFVEVLEILLTLHFYRDDSIKRTSFFFDQMWRNFLSNDAASELEGIILSTVIGWRHMFNWKRPSLSFTYLIIWSYSMDIMIISNFHFLRFNDTEFRVLLLRRRWLIIFCIFFFFCHMLWLPLLFNRWMFIQLI